MKGLNCTLAPLNTWKQTAMIGQKINLAHFQPIFSVKLYNIISCAGLFSMLQSNFSLFRKVLRGESRTEYFMPTVYVSVKVRKVKKLNSNARFMYALQNPKTPKIYNLCNRLRSWPRWLQHLAFSNYSQMHLLPCVLRWKIWQMVGNKFYN